MDNSKAVTFKKFLDEGNIKGFDYKAVEDQLNSVVFHGYISVKGQSLPMAVVIDNSVYTIIRIQIAGRAISEKEYFDLSAYVNRLNQTYRMLKYFVTPEGQIILTCCIISDTELFAPTLVIAVLDEIIKHLNIEYPDFMKMLWNQKSES